MDAGAAAAYGLITDLVLLLLMIGTMVLVLKKHAAGLKIVWKLLAAMLLIIFLQPILQAAVSNEPSMKRTPATRWLAYSAAIPSPMLLPASPGPSPSLLSSFTKWPSKTRTAKVRRRGFRASI